MRVVLGEDLALLREGLIRLMAEGRSNGSIAARLFVTEKAVGKHIANIFGKSDLPLSGDDNRRVLAVLAYSDAV
ncbi:LuxR C-terminal-related transcriptional regulator [Saccharothrix xinjiangensis]|uniref:LuxR C-terminal-related transcriptional regulator n=1 Tax=Saccharothrix xinjiangensis TaxID=204798 RepID=A0ABV9XXA9_9PSEU